ncbi:hypothetical protein ABZS66_19070 [Dactylosporangium sp. NPDC005572]|uniref:hypothetical protein n=1 Tax=Dactylosporangium sp. NPDC005572 TaxID=3156889 RepID=UPI0033A03DA8
MTTTSPTPTAAVQVPDLDAALAEIREFNNQRSLFISNLENHAGQQATIIARLIEERRGETTTEGSPLWDGRVHMGLAGATGLRAWTLDEKTTGPDGRTRTRVTVKRACNGCGTTLGDASNDDLDHAMAGLPAPDVRRECPTCGPALALQEASNRG